MEPVKLTEKQREANRLLAGPARNVMLRGGSRSGKTFVLCRAIIQRAINAPDSRHVIFRFRFNHAKTSVWSDTLPKVLKLCFPSLRVRFDKTDFYIELPNGSQVWIAGLDDKERVEKILGQEYATLYFNESSQIPWSSVETAMSRLAQRAALAPAIAAATGRQFLTLKAYFDCNPPSKLHWSYQLFRAGLKPGTKEALPNPGDYVEMRVNPSDNADNLPAEYFDVLASMSAARRLRFEAGEWASEVNGALWALEDRKAPDGKTMPGIDSLRIAEAPEEYDKAGPEDDDDIDLGGDDEEGEEGTTAPRRVAANDAEPRTLYVRRDVLNAADIIAHFKAQGFETTLPADDMHVTITFSRKPVDWFEMGENWSGDEKGRLTINVGGPRMMDRFGQAGEATVLLFASSTLSWRHEDMVRQGATWDHPEYQPHITISYGAADLDLSKVEPYRGEIVLGPEVFEEVKEDWQNGVAEE